MHIARSMESDGWARLHDKHDNHVQSHLLNAFLVTEKSGRGFNGGF